MKKSINIIGAFDRYNFGDLLFPIVIEEYLIKYMPSIIKEFDINYYGLIDSDLSAVGGKKTQNLKSLYKKEIIADSIIIVSGGEVIGSMNRNLYLDLQNNYVESVLKRNIIRVANKVLGEKVVNKFFRTYFGLASDYPWIIEKKHFKVDVKIAYNTVGGRLPQKNTSYYREEINKAEYISIREIEAMNKMALQKSNLSPDSVSIISSLYPEERILGLINQSAKEFVDNVGDYVCIQTNYKLYKENKSAFIAEINKLINSKKSTSVLLLPIGFATNHDDLVALRDIKKKFDKNVYLIEDINIYDIIYLISKSMFFVGSSLHGNITAMSYCVPHIGIGNKPKLRSYLNTWDLKEQNHCIRIEEIQEYYLKLKSISPEKLASKKMEIEKLVFDNFEKMIQHIT
jgi:hypothetical protein